MKQLQKSDLKVSKIYKLKAHNREYLYRISDMRTSMTLCNDGYLIIDDNRFNKISNISQSRDFADAKYIETKQKYEFYNATPEEKHWLKECIKVDTFVSYEDAMKTFVQYYKIIESKIAMNYNNNVIHEESIVFGHYNGNNRIIKAIETGKHRVFSTTDVLYGEIGDQKICFDMLALEPSTKEAYDVQFVVKKPEIILEEPKDKVLLSNSEPYLNAPFNIIKVESSEGGVYKIGDKIKVFTHNSPNKGKVFTIKGFRWNNTKTKLCAVTELHTPNGIGLDKIELYIEPKNQQTEIVDDFVLPEKWCVEVNQEIRSKFNYYFAEGYHHSIQINDTNKWSDKIKEGFTEITFEQFKKYVLKDE